MPASSSFSALGPWPWPRDTFSNLRLNFISSASLSRSVFDETQRILSKCNASNVCQACSGQTYTGNTVHATAAPPPLLPTHDAPAMGSAPGLSTKMSGTVGLLSL